MLLSMRENKITISVNTFYFSPTADSVMRKWTPLISRHFHDLPMKQMLLQNPWQTLTNKANVDRLDLGLLTNNKTCKFIKNNTILLCISSNAWGEGNCDFTSFSTHAHEKMNLPCQIENIVCWSMLTALPCPYLSRECVCRTDEIDCRGKGLRKLPADLPQEHNVAKL